MDSRVLRAAACKRPRQKDSHSYSHSTWEMNGSVSDAACLPASVPMHTISSKIAAVCFESSVAAAASMVVALLSTLVEMK